MCIRDRPFLGFYRQDGLGIGATAADQRLLSRTRGHPAGGHLRWLGSSRSIPACRRAESAGRDGRTAGLFELAGGLDRYLSGRIGDLAQRCRDLDGYPLAHPTDRAPTPILSLIHI